MIITSVKNPQIVFLKQIQKNKNKEYFIIEGYHLVEEALKHNLVVNTYETELKRKYEDSILITENVLKSLSMTKTPQGIIALCKKLTPNKELNRILFLDNVQDPGNVGTLIRSAYAFGFDTIYSNVDFYNEKIIRSTQGALFNMNLINYTDSFKTLEKLKNDDFKIWLTTLDSDAKELSEISFPKDKIVIVLGNEGNGITNVLYKLSNLKVKINCQFESLNVAVAGAIILNKIYNS